jgi:hypothetical protein
VALQFKQFAAFPVSIPILAAVFFLLVNIKYDNSGVFFWAIACDFALICKVSQKAFDPVGPWE